MDDADLNKPATASLPPETADAAERAALREAAELMGATPALEGDAPDDEVPEDEVPEDDAQDDAQNEGADDDGAGLDEEAADGDAGVAAAAAPAEPPPLPPIPAEVADRFVATQVAHQLGDWIDRPHIDLHMADLREAVRTRGAGFAVWDAAQNTVIMANDPGAVEFDGQLWQRREGASVKAARLAAILNELRPLARTALYCIDMEDARGPGKADGRPPIPVFQFHRRPFAGAAILWPLAGTHDLGTTAFLGKPRLSEMRWRRKEALVYWRGTLAGTAIVKGQRRSSQKMLDAFQQRTLTPPKLRQELRHIPRFHVVEQAQGQPFIDAGFVLDDKDAHLAENPVIGPLVRERVPNTRWLRHRYLLKLEGYDVSTTLYWGLNSNSVVFKQEYCWDTFADVHFRPWVHYVPVKGEISDIAFKFGWCEQRVPMCERISAQARLACRLLGEADLRARALAEVVSIYEARFRRVG